MPKKLQDFPEPQQAVIKQAVERYPYSMHSFVFGTYIPDSGYVYNINWTMLKQEGDKDIWVNQFAEHIEVGC